MRRSRRSDATLPQAGLSDVATEERIEYALQRARAVERKHPLLSLIYRVVAEVLHHEKKVEDDG